ncbi:flavin-dependent oxidoreductase [Tistrella bauzanensis]|uniref:flavin-dependent oxidoreductase n=1 Tax=Tistrella TaxID=171436 RepID=UPI0031F66F61
MKVIIIGAGIGGLTAALSLHAAGIETMVYEAVPDMRPLGVGINLLPHAVRELTELGLADDLARIGVATSALIYTNKLGQEIWREARGLDAGYHWPQYSIHRGHLQMLLFEVARTRLGADRVLCDHAAAKVSTDAQGMARVDLVSRATGAARGHDTADLIIGADGIHSAVRAQFNPDEGLPKWNGRILWRGVSEAAPYLDGRTMVMAGHQDQKFVCYPIDPALAAEGRSLINWIAELNLPDRELEREDWNRPGMLDDFLPAFAGWDFGWLDVPSIIRQAVRVFEFPMVDRDPLDGWTHGRVTLMGDAAHPMYPIGSNGASQAILDARMLVWRLAGAVAGGGDIDAVLAAYEAERRPATARIVLANRANGPEKVMQLVEERAPEGFAAIDAVLPAAELTGIIGDYKHIAGFDKDALNARPSLHPVAVRGADTVLSHS